MSRQEVKVAGISKEAHRTVQRGKDTNSHQLSFGFGSIQAFIAIGMQREEILVVTLCVVWCPRRRKI